jgi:hypothetical protein
MRPTKESGSGEAINLASNLTYEPTPDEIERASNLILDLVAERDALQKRIKELENVNGIVMEHRDALLEALRIEMAGSGFTDSEIDATLTGLRPE